MHDFKAEPRIIDLISGIMDMAYIPFYPNKRGECCKATLRLGLGLGE